MRTIACLAAVVCLAACARPRRLDPAVLEGTYRATLPAADASSRLVTLTLGPDGGATIGTEYAGRGTAPADQGRWTVDGDRLTVTLTGAPALVYEVRGDRLVPRQWDRSRYGEAGLPLARTGILRGTVTYRQRTALPPDATVHVILEDVSRADGPAVRVAETVVATQGHNVPISFELAYEPAAIDPTAIYQVAARIEAGGRLRFVTTHPHPVITRGPTADVEIVVSPAH